MLDGVVRLARRCGDSVWRSDNQRKAESAGALSKLLVAERTPVRMRRLVVLKCALLANVTIAAGIAGQGASQLGLTQRMGRLELTCKIASNLGRL